MKKSIIGLTVVSGLLFGMSSCTENKEITPEIVNPTTITLNSMEIGGTFHISPARNVVMDWTSNAPSVVKVDDDGIITALKVGGATIIAEEKGTDYRETFSITVVEKQIPTKKVVVGIGTSYQLKEGTELPINVTVLNADEADLELTSSNTAVFTIENRVITAQGEGTAQIKAVIGDVIEYANVVVTKEAVVAPSITSNFNTFKLVQGSDDIMGHPCKLMILPSSITAKAKAEVSDRNLANCVSLDGRTFYIWSDKDGIAGEGQIVFTVPGTDLKLTVDLVVTAKAVDAVVSDIKLETVNKKFIVGEKFMFATTVLPSNAKDKTLTWNSNDNSIVTVDNNGLATAVKAGSTTITVESSNGVKKTIAVSVSDSDFTMFNYVNGHKSSMNKLASNKLTSGAACINKGAKAEFSFVTPQPLFNINKETGEITSKDYLRVGTYEMEVKAVDALNISNRTVDDKEFMTSRIKFEVKSDFAVLNNDAKIHIQESELLDPSKIDAIVFSIDENYKFNSNRLDCSLVTYESVIDKNYKLTKIEKSKVSINSLAKFEGNKVTVDISSLENNFKSDLEYTIVVKGFEELDDKNNSSDKEFIKEIKIHAPKMTSVSTKSDLRSLRIEQVKIGDEDFKSLTKESNKWGVALRGNENSEAHFVLKDVSNKENNIDIAGLFIVKDFYSNGKLLINEDVAESGKYDLRFDVTDANKCDECIKGAEINYNANIEVIVNKLVIPSNLYNTEKHNGKRGAVIVDIASDKNFSLKDNSKYSFSISDKDFTIDADGTVIAKDEAKNVLHKDVKISIIFKADSWSSDETEVVSYTLDLEVNA